MISPGAPGARYGRRARHPIWCPRPPAPSFPARGRRRQPHIAKQAICHPRQAHAKSAPRRRRPAPGRSRPGAGDPDCAKKNQLLQNNTINTIPPGSGGQRAGDSGAARDGQPARLFLILGKDPGSASGVRGAAATLRPTREINSPVALILFTQNGALKRAQPFPFSLHSVASFLVISILPCLPARTRPAHPVSQRQGKILPFYPSGRRLAAPRPSQEMPRIF